MTFLCAANVRFAEKNFLDFIGQNAVFDGDFVNIIVFPNYLIQFHRITEGQTNLKVCNHNTNRRDIEGIEQLSDGFIQFARLSFGDAFASEFLNFRRIVAVLRDDLLRRAFHLL